MTRSSTPRRRRGFTLMEVLLVLVILVILAGMAVPAYQSIQRGANNKAARAQIGAFKTALDAFRMDLGDYPYTAQGLQALLVAPADVEASRGNWPYMEKDVRDPWGRPYQYMYPGQNNPTGGPDIWSMGQDGVSGTEDDIGNWQ